jgi:hypothetical protein
MSRKGGKRIKIQIAEGSGVDVKRTPEAAALDASAGGEQTYEWCEGREEVRPNGNLQPDRGTPCERKIQPDRCVIAVTA